MSGFYLIAGILVVGASIALSRPGQGTKWVGEILLIVAELTGLGGVLNHATTGLSLLDVVVLVVVILVAIGLGDRWTKMLGHLDFPISSTE